MLCSLAGPQSLSLHYPRPCCCTTRFDRTTRLQHQKATEANAFFGRGRGGDRGQHDKEDIVSPSWGEESPDWTDAPEQLDLLEEIWYEDDASPEALAQNALAVALSALLIWGFGSILWKLAVVSYALFAAAFRYSFVAFVLLVVVVFLAA
ncbi:TPA: hypothetical protein ACH3X2_003735 [Trebouxia sp. C0005]